LRLAVEINEKWVQLLHSWLIHHSSS